MLDHYRLVECREKLDAVPTYRAKSKLLYDWVKQSYVSLGEFQKLMEYILP